MKLGRREEKFVHRVVVLMTLAIAMGIGIVVVKESREIQKLLEPSFARDLLLLFGPLAGLAMTGYSLASRALSSAGLLGEFVSQLGAYALFLAVALPSFVKREVASPEVCKFWQMFCEETLSVRDQRITILFLIVAAALILLSLFRAKVFLLGREK